MRESHKQIKESSKEIRETRVFLVTKSLMADPPKEAITSTHWYTLTTFNKHYLFYNYNFLKTAFFTASCTPLVLLHYFARLNTMYE